MNINIDDLSLRDLQKECAKAVLILGGDNNTLSQFNKESHHNSQKWYKAVLQHYISKFGDIPSNTIQGKNIKTIL